MPADRVAIVNKHSQFYRNNFRRLLTVMFILLGVGYILLGLIIYQYYTRPEPHYFATTSDGRLIEIQPIK